MYPKVMERCSLTELWQVHEAMGFGVVVFDHRHHVMSESSLAHRLLERAGIDTKSFVERELLKDVMRRSSGKGQPHAAIRLVLRRPDRVDTLFVDVCTVHLDEQEPGDYYLLLLRDPSLMLGDEVRVLGEVYGLTRRESELACHIAVGLDLAQFAKDKFVSLYTAKSHLKQIFRKMGVHRQSELVVNVLSVVL